MTAIATKQPEAISPAKALLDFVINNDRLNYLKARWLDEREYEDFEEYRTEIRKVFEAEGYACATITKSFAIDVSKGNDRFTVTILATKVRVQPRKGYTPSKTGLPPRRFFKKYFVRLQTSDNSLGMAMHEVDTFADASKAVREYIERLNLTAGCGEHGTAFTGGKIYDTATRSLQGHVSYNGRVWDLVGKEIEIGQGA